MSNDFPRKRRFSALIDLTTRAQETTKNEAAASLLAADSARTAAAAVPDATLEDVPEAVRAAVVRAGWPALMPVQARTMPVMLSGTDLIVQSKTGSGKTGAFLLPLFVTLDATSNATQALVMTPTRELARQIYEEFERLGGPDQGLRAALVYGGVGYNEQTKALREGAHVVIGTPGRVLDLLERRTFSLDALKTLVLDEADEMLSMGFLPAMRKLRRYLPEPRQSTMFSATMPPGVRSLARDFLTEPQFLALAGGHVKVDALEHRFYTLGGLERDRALVRIIELENPESAILFANTKRDVEYLAQFLRNYGHDAGELSGDLSQQARETIMQRVREGRLRFLVATDVAARGIDISDLTHVIQYDVPQDPEYYVHRAGRTARAGKTGTSITLATPETKPKLLGIFRRYDLDFEEREVPSEESVTERLRERLTVLLEDRYREMRNMARERASRFETLGKALAIEEPHLLAMLLDGLYHESLHAPPQQEIIDVTRRRATESRFDEEERPRSRERRTDRDERPRREDRPRRESAPVDAETEAPTARLQEAADEIDPVVLSPVDETEVSNGAATAPSDERAPAEGEGRRRRKKKRRKKSGASLEPQGATDDGDDADGEFESDDAPAVTSADTDVDAAPPVDFGVADAVEDAPASTLPVEPIPVAAADEDSGARSRRRGGRGRREDAPVADSDETIHDAVAEAAREEAAPEAALPEPDVAAPTADAPRRAGGSKRTPGLPAGPFRISDLQGMSTVTLRAVAADLGVDDAETARVDDLVFSVLEVQAERESAGARRRPAERAEARGRNGRSGRGAGRNAGRGASPRADASEKGRADGRGKSEPRGKSDAGSKGDGARRDAARPDPTRRPAPIPAEPTTDAASEASEAKSRRRRGRRGKGNKGTGALETGAVDPATSDLVTADGGPAETPVVETPPAAEAPAPRGRGRGRAAAPATDAAPAPSSEAPSDAPAPKPSRSRKKAAAETDAPTEAATQADAETPAAPKRRATRAKAAPDADAAGAPAPEGGETAPVASTRSRKKAVAAETDATLAAPTSDADPAPKPTRSRKKAAPTEADTASAETPGAAPAKPSRSRKKAVAETDAVSTPEVAPQAETPAAPKRRATRAKAAPASDADASTGDAA